MVSRGPGWKHARWLPLIALVVAAFSVGCAIGSGAPPSVSYTTPADGTASFPAGNITAVFNRAMDSTSITSTSFLVYQGTTPIPGTVTASGNTATFVPTTSLPFGALFTATITTAARDLSGSSLAQNHVWTFTTEMTFAKVVLQYTTTFIPSAFSRYGGPVTFTNGGNTLSQTVNSDGSITLTITAAPGDEDNGFYFTIGRLSSFNSLTVTAAAGSGPFSANLWLDSNNDGDFFAWSGNVISGLGGDHSLNGPASVGTTLTLGSATMFSGYTVPQLIGGSLAGVNGTTNAAIWIGTAVNSGSLTATITGIQLQ